jgi:hypothetical protein
MLGYGRFLKNYCHKSSLQNQVTEFFLNIYFYIRTIIYILVYSFFMGKDKEEIRLFLTIT